MDAVIVISNNVLYNAKRFIYEVEFIREIDEL